MTNAATPNPIQRLAGRAILRVRFIDDFLSSLSAGFFQPNLRDRVGELKVR
jgi:hypothetical protein